MALLYSKDLTIAKKVTSSGAQSDARDYYWFRSPMPNQICRRLVLVIFILKITKNSKYSTHSKEFVEYYV